jgi:hypothetical protein
MGGMDNIFYGKHKICGSVGFDIKALTIPPAPDVT